VILSNHGGRNLDTARSGIEILPEVMRDLRSAGLDEKIDVFVDGGIRRGTDILKVRNCSTVPPQSRYFSLLLCRNCVEHSCFRETS